MSKSSTTITEGSDHRGYRSMIEMPSTSGREGLAVQQPEFMTEPAKVFKAYLRGSRSEDRWYQYGMLAMALEIISRIKLLEDLPVTTEVGRQEAITCLQTMLTELGISDIAYEWYDILAEWRRPKFLPAHASAFDAQLERALPSDSLGGPLRPGGLPHSHASLLASEPEVLRGALAPLEGTDELQQERPSPSPGEIAIASLGELHDVAPGTTPFLSGKSLPPEESSS